MTEKRFKHSEFQQDDGQYQYYGIEDTEKNFVYNVIGDGMYDVSEELLINILNELAEENEEFRKRTKELIAVSLDYPTINLDLIAEAIKSLRELIE